VKVIFPVDKPNFKLTDLDSIKGFVSSDAGGHLYFVLLYNEKKTADDKVAATVAKIYRSDGLAWSTNYLLSFVPTEISFKPETSELMLKGDSQQSTLDKNGKLK
jgi:hypothetical protein